MKQLFSQLLLYFILISCTSEQNQEAVLVSDFEQILSADQEDDLNNLIIKHEQKTTNEIAIVTTPNWENHENILFYAVDFGEKLGVGKKDKDNGVVIVFSKNMRETRISTGYGTEKILKDEIAKEIIDSLMIPKFKQDQYFEGIYAGTKAVVDFLEKPENEIK